MHIFQKSFKLSPLIVLFISLLFIGCEENETTPNSPTTLGSAASVVTSDFNATMAPSPATLKSINSNIATILKTDIDTQNQKEATTFTKETQYCDISGIQEYTNSGTLSKITKTQKFDACKNAQFLQNGHIKIDYDEMDNEGKFPKIVKLIVEDDFTFNDILLKKGTIISSTIQYNEDNTIKSISLTSNGAVNYQYGNYGLVNDSDTITF